MTRVSVQRQRTVLVAVVLGVTALAAVPLGVLWPSSSRSDGAYAFIDVEPVRQQWWLVLTLLAALLPLNLASQAIATMVLVRERGGAWATWGGVLMFVGGSLQAVGITFLAGCSGRSSRSSGCSDRAPCPAGSPSAWPSSWPRSSCRETVSSDC